MTILQFAQAINELTGNLSGIVFKPLPVDDPNSAGLTSAKPDGCLAGSPLCRCARAWKGPSTIFVSDSAWR